MKIALFFERIKLFAIFMATGLIGGAVALAGHSFLPHQNTFSANTGAMPKASAMEYIDAYNCKRAETKVVMFHGKDDKFSYEGVELAKINPEMLESPYYRDLVGEKNKVHSHRDYDERGVDKVLYDHFKISGKITNGIFLTRVRPQGSVETDSFALGDFKRSLLKSENYYEFVYSINYDVAFSSYRVENTADLLAIPIAAFGRQLANSEYSDLLSFLKSDERSPILDLAINDDTMIDFSALILCQLPVNKMGATFTEGDAKLYGPKVSHLGCNSNKTQPMCDPIIGDQLCSVPTPLACYKDGDASLPVSENIPIWGVVGGEVRMTNPVRGDQFKTYTDALRFCRNQFGDEWRVLSFHEAGGGTVTSLSDIPVNSRMLIDVTDQPHATCWIRD